MNKLLFLCFLLLLPSFSYALQDQVIILDLLYDEGNISLQDSTIKYGFYPDRRFQPQYGYTLQVLAEEEIMYGFVFGEPFKEHREGTNEQGELFGGLHVLNYTLFSLTLPYYDNMTHILIYDPKEVIAANFIFTQENYTTRWLLAAGILLLTVILVIAFLYKKRSR